MTQWKSPSTASLVTARKLENGENLRDLRIPICYLVLTLDSEQVVTMKAVRVHCHAAPKIGSDTSRGRPTPMAAATSAIAATASVPDLLNFMVLTDVRRTRDP